MRRFALLSLAVAALLPASAARTQTVPVFGASADLVVIDLIATGDDGRLVADLRPEELSVFEDGKPQRLELARYVTAGGQRRDEERGRAGPRG